MTISECQSGEKTGAPPAKEEAHVRNIMRKIRALMTAHHVDAIARDFDGTCWRPQARRCFSFRDSLLWQPGRV